MEIYFLKIDSIDVEKLEIENKYSCKKRNIEYNLGRYLVKSVAKSVYNLDNTEIVDEKKPYFKYSNLNFSISHSDKIIGVVFSEDILGLDIEKVKQRNYKEIAKRMHFDCNNLKEFYKCWTCFEARYKSKKHDCLSFEYEDYICSVSKDEIDNVNVFLVKFSNDKILLTNWAIKNFIL